MAGEWAEGRVDAILFPKFFYSIKIIYVNDHIGLQRDRYNHWIRAD